MRRSLSPRRPAILGLDAVGCSDQAAGAGREWLVTNGLGGYALGTLGGAPTRTYHGLLVAALRPPVDRTVLVGGLDERVTAAGATGTSDRRARTLRGGPGGTLVGVRLDGLLPVWTHRVGRAVLERRLWMAADANETLVRWALLDGPALRLTTTVLVTARDHHAARAHPGNRRPPVALAGPRRARIRLRTSVGPLDLAVVTDRGQLVSDGPGLERWTRPIALPEETSRGQADRTAGFAAVRLEVDLLPGRSVTLRLSAPTPDRANRPARPRGRSLREARRRHRRLLTLAGAERASTLTRQLVLAADQFLVGRSIPDPDGGPPIDGRSVIAGYPWFTDWGRDTMIAVPGLALATGRAAEAATILRSYAAFRRDGLLPNSFPDEDGVQPAYHAMDAPLWFVEAVRAYEVATGDEDLVSELLPGIVEGLAAYVAGTRFGIGLDPDGLVRGGAPGLQLTWMDAKVGDWVVTPRAGKPVEIQGLWHNALRLAAGWLRDRGRAADAARWEALAERAQASFERRFWREELGYLADVVDGPAGDDPALRPNQLLALSLAHPIFGGRPETARRARRAVAACRAALLTPVGLRSLAPSDPSYRASFQGDRRHRDAAYHNGTVWSWLVGPYIDAVLRLTGDVDHARSVLRPFEAHLADGALGTISEVFEPEPPFAPRGCVAQAWSVAEVLRLSRLLAD
jgi:glycogen debranching enzyme